MATYNYGSSGITYGSNIAYEQLSNVTAPFGVEVGRVTATSSSSSISTTVYYPSKITASGSPSVAPYPFGGEPLSLSAYVFGPAGTYTITLNGGTTSYSNSVVVPALTWVRIHVVGYADKATVASPTLGATISSNVASGSRWYVDGVQLEFGDTPSTFINPSVATTITIPNPKGGTMFASTSSMTEAGRSYYWPRKFNKTTRLNANLTNFLPSGSSFSVLTGEPTEVFSETYQASLGSSSFENNLRNWTAVGSTVLTRVEGRGSIFGEVGALGGSWVSCTNSAAETSLGLYQANIPVTPSANYKFSIATQITSSANTGTVTAKVDWYTSSNTLISGSSTTLTRALVSADVGKWCYIGTPQIAAPATAYYATVTMTMAKTSGSTKTVLFDRVILSET